MPALIFFENSMKISPFLITAICLAGSAQAASPSTAPAPDLDLSISYYSKVLTPEGVTREARYEDKMVRRPGHVWVARVLPRAAAHQDAAHDGAQDGDGKPASKTPQHKQFNYVVMPRHVTLEDNKLRVEYIAAHDKEIVAVPVSEYDNVNFDGSWANTYYLLDPQQVKAMPLSAKPSPVPGARWREREKNGMFQRVLWDERKQIPLVIESGDKASTFYRRVEVKLQAGLTGNLPWQNLKGYAQKEYADFLD
jgi:hypothetical protein